MVLEQAGNLAYVPKRISYGSLEKMKDILVIVLCIEEVFNPLARALFQTL